MLFRSTSPGGGAAPADVRAPAKDGSEEMIVLGPTAAGAQGPRVMLHALLAARAETKRDRKRAKARARELAALLRLKLRPDDADAGGGGGGGGGAGEDGALVAGAGGTKGPTRSAAQLAAKMLFRRREAGDRPLGGRAPRAGYAQSPLARAARVRGAPGAGADGMDVVDDADVDAMRL